MSKIIELPAYKWQITKDLKRKTKTPFEAAIYYMGKAQSDTVWDSDRAEFKTYEKALEWIEEKLEGKS